MQMPSLLMTTDE